ncbi:prolyl oligopeptidase family protein [imported], putative [Actinomycetales bacterium JB111]|nr:prolyl oligopeptidase family protein [imported], putative [Actinomycetales bacterium JB111]
MTSDDATTTPFHSLDSYIALPRLGGLTLSPDGARAVTAVTTLEKDTTYRTALWSVDPAGSAPARRLTRGTTGESSATFSSTGDLYFTASRPDADDEDGKRSRLWALRGGAEAEVVADHPGGIEGVIAARDAETIIVRASVLPGSTSLTSDRDRRKERTDKKVAAILHDSYPVRFWDHDLGPAAPHLYRLEPATDSGLAAGPEAAASSTGSASDEQESAEWDGAGTLVDLTPDAELALREVATHITDDGATIVTGWQIPASRGTVIGGVAAIDTATGERRWIVEPTEELEAAVVALTPDGTSAVISLEEPSTPEQPEIVTLVLVDLATGSRRTIAEGWDRWISEAAVLPDGTGMLAIADDRGRAPVFHVPFDGGEVTRLTGDGAFSSLRIAPDGTFAIAQRASYAAPNAPVRIDLSVLAEPALGGAETTEIPSPAPAPALPGTLTEVETTADDGTPLRGFLAMPENATADNPAPLLLWVHGGPVSSWNTWSWRWCPWLAVAEGYAVLLPDPALSTGYGWDFIKRGWGRWGAEPFTDVMAVLDAAEELPEIDASRTAAMGGSFGGYMANWIAGHTDRFKAIVTHASLWNLETFNGATDAAWYWEREMTPQMRKAYSPHHAIADISTPMLVIHGDKDYRVPIGEGLSLWRALVADSALAADSEGRTPHRFLYFPDENHWILTPQHAKVWYQVVLGYLAEHVLGEEPRELPDVLG